MPSPAERASSTICPARVSTVHLGPAATFILYRDELPELLFGPGFGADGQQQPVFGLGAFGQCPRGDPLPAAGGPWGMSFCCLAIARFGRVVVEHLAQLPASAVQA